MARELTPVVECWTTGGLTSSDSFQAQNQGFELPYPNIYAIDELLEL